MSPSTRRHREVAASASARTVRLVLLAAAVLLLVFVVGLSSTATTGSTDTTIVVVDAWQQQQLPRLSRATPSFVTTTASRRATRTLPWLAASNNDGGGSDDESGGGTGGAVRLTPSEEERPEYPLPRQINEELLGDLTGGRPGAIIETEEQLATKAQILSDIESGRRRYPDWFDDYGELAELEEADYDVTDDPDAIDAGTIGTWTIQDIRSRFEYEWDPNDPDEETRQRDPNISELNQPGTRYVEETEKDEDGVEVGYDPIFGPSSPVDRRTLLGTKDSYMVDDATRDDTMLTPQFRPDDPERTFNDEIVRFRKSLDIIETFVDPFLQDEVEVPRHVAKWHGYPERTHFKAQNFTNNRFTAPSDRTDFDSMTPYDARRKAVELARSKNAEWLPDGVSQSWHREQRLPYEQYGTLVGTLRKGDCDSDVVEMIQPALRVLGSCIELLSTEGPDGTVFRFAYHGLMKNKHGMKAWAETLLRDCGVDVTGVVFETGFRRRDPPYDGGDYWYGPY